MSELTLPLEIDENSRIPVKKQLCDQLIDLIINLKIMPGQMLPSSRELATALGISRATTVRAYKELIARGYIETIEGVGTFVCKRFITPVEDVDKTVTLKLSRYAYHLMMLKPDRLTPHDFPELQHGASPIELLPFKQWKNALNKAQETFRKNPELIDFGTEPFGYIPLRRAIAGYLKRSSMIDISEDNLIVCSSSVYLLELVSELLIDPATPVAFPEPGPLFARDIFNKLGARIIPVPVDEEGLIVNDLKQLKELPEIVYLNSSHQEPTGACLSMERRKDLIDWAQKHSIMIVEDDFDSQFRYQGARQAPLRALSAGANIVYLSSFWRTLYPLINVSYMVVPDMIIPFLKQSWYLTQGGFHTHFPIFEEKALEIFINQGDYEKHLANSSSILADRLRNCIYQLTFNFGKTILVSQESSSYHIFIRFLNPEIKENHILEMAANAGLPLLSARGNYLLSKNENAYLIPFAYLEKSDLSEKISRFKNLMIKLGLVST